MSEYIPEEWAIIKFELNGNTEYKVFGSWRGGYLTGDSWRLNSGISKVEEHDNYYHFYGYSGSVYRCRKGRYGITGMHNNGVLRQIVEADKDIKAEILNEDTAFLSIIIEQG